LKKFIYLISPNKIEPNFYKNLDSVLSSGKIKFFQLRLKNYSLIKLIKISQKIKVLTKKHKVNLIINDFPIVAKRINADGCHLGQSDETIRNTKKLLKKNKIVGITCHGSKKLVSDAIKNKVDYIAIGSFFKSKLKPKAKKAKISLVKWCKKQTHLPIVAIGGINNKNYKILIKTGVNYLAISSFIWNNPRFKPKEAIMEFK